MTARSLAAINADILAAKADAEAALSEGARLRAEVRFERLLHERDEAELAAAEGRPVTQGDHRDPKLITPVQGSPSGTPDHLRKAVPPREIVEVTVLASVKAEPVEWAWPDRIPFGFLTLLDGDPGLGKSTLAADLAARVTTGAPMPDGIDGGEPAGVLVASAEDDLSRTIRPRLEAAGADLPRVFTMTIRASAEDAEGRLPVLPFDVPEVEKVIADRGIRFVILDPLMALLDGEVNSFRDQDVRRALAPVAAMARRTRAVVLVIRHLNKGTGASPIYRGGGSIGIAGAARSVLLVAKDPDDPERRILAAVKSNLGPPAPSLSFRLAPVEGKPREYLAVRWEGTSPLAATDLLAAAAVPVEDSGPIGEAGAFLRDLLANGPVPAREVLARARAAGHTDPTLRRAKGRLGIASKKSGLPGEVGEWRWSLPAEGDHEGPKMITSRDGAPSGGSDHTRGPASGPESPPGRESGLPPAESPCFACRNPGKGQLHFGCLPRECP